MPEHGKLLWPQLNGNVIPVWSDDRSVDGAQSGKAMQPSRVKRPERVQRLLAAPYPSRRTYIAIMDGLTD